MDRRGDIGGIDIVQFALYWLRRMGRVALGREASLKIIEPGPVARFGRRANAAVSIEQNAVGSIVHEKGSMNNPFFRTFVCSS